jgi:capsular exopolysaccharide synthesis family protein
MWCPNSVFLENEGGFDAWKYWFIARKHVRLVTLVFVLVLAAVAYKVFTQTPLYTAETTILLKENVPDVLAPNRGSDGDQYSDTYFQTQKEMLQSHSLAARVIHDLNLMEDPEFIGGPSSKRSLIRTAVERRSLSEVVRHRDEKDHTKANLVENGISSWVIDQYLGLLSVTLEQGTTLIKIAFSTPSPDLSRRLADAHAEAYARMGVEFHNQSDLEFEKYLHRRLSELRAQLEKSEIALNNYRRQHDIIPGLMSLDGKETLVLDRLQDLSKELTAAELERIGYESQVQVISKKNYDSLPSVQNSKALQDLEIELNSEDAEVASLSNQFTPSYPPLAKARAKAAKTRQHLHHQISRVVESIMAAYKIAIGKENRLRTELDGQKREALGLNDAAVRYAMLQREVDTNRELTNNVLQKMKNVGFEAGSEATNVSIVDPAATPTFPSSPKKARDLCAGAAAGFAVGLLLALALEYFSSTLNTPDEVERFLRLPNLGVIPEFSAEAHKLAISAPRSGGLLAVSGAVSRNEVIVGFEPYSAVADAYRSIRTAILLSQAGSPPKIILVTSARRGEGKTVTAINTALMFAQVGAKVVLVDADLRSGRCHQTLGLNDGSKSGLTELLVGSYDPLYIRNTAVPNLFLLPRGTRPPNSTELVGSQRMSEVLHDLASMFDFVVLDSPPLIPISDSTLLASMVDGVLLVIDSARTPKKQMKSARLKLDYARAKIYGFVINRMQPKSFYYRDYYGDYYERPQAKDQAA